jgi:hypothetical protein
MVWSGGSASGPFGLLCMCNQMGKFASSQNCRFFLTKLDKEGWILWRLGWALGEKQEKGLGQDSASVFNAASPGQVVEMYIRLILCLGMKRWWRRFRVW